MKIISLSGFILSVLFLGFALYLHFVVAPAAKIAQAKFESIEPSEDEAVQAERGALMEEGQLKTDYGIVALLGSILPFLLCVIAAFKKQKIAYLGILFSLTSFFIGAAYGSHMFS